MSVLNLQVSQSKDDNYEDSNGNSNHLTAAFMALSSTQLNAAAILRGATAAGGSTISSAILSVWGNNANTLNCEIYAELNATPADLTASSFNISTRTKTTNHVTFNHALSTSAFTTLDITTVIQEVANLSGFTDVCIIFFWTSGSVQIRSWDNVPADAVKLDITYTTGGTTAKTSLLAMMGVG